MIDDREDEVIKSLFISLLNRCEKNELMKGSEFVYDYVHLLYYKCHKINRNPGRSRDSLHSIKKRKKSNNKLHQ